MSVDVKGSVVPEGNANQMKLTVKIVLQCRVCDTQHMITDHTTALSMLGLSDRVEDLCKRHVGEKACDGEAASSCGTVSIMPRRSRERFQELVLAQAKKLPAWDTVGRVSVA